MIESSNVELFRVHAAAIDRWPGWHIRAILPDRRDTERLDVLVPIHSSSHGVPKALGPEETYYFWADLTIPRGANPGAYAGNIRLLSSGVQVADIPIRLTVQPLVLPDANAIPFLVELDHRRIEDWISTVRLLQRHRMTPILPYLVPRVAVGSRGDPKIDWSEYDSVVTGFLNGEAFENRVPLAFWPLPLSNMTSFIGGSERVTSPSSREFAREYVALCLDHFQAAGWHGRAFAALPASVGRRGESEDALRRLAELFDGAKQPAPLVSRGFPQDMAPFGWTGFQVAKENEFVKVWAPPAQFFDPSVMANQRQRGKHIWFSVDRPPYSGSVSIHAPPPDTRVLAWQALQLGAEAVWVGPANHWPSAESNPRPADCIRFDADTLLYPGEPFGLTEPVASVRLKLLRRGLEDAAVARLLTAKGLDHVQRALSRALAPYAGTNAYRSHYADGRSNGWTEDWRHFESARQIMTSELQLSSGSSQAAAPTDSFERSAAWRSLMNATGNMEVTVDGARVRLPATSAAREAEVECSVSVRNGGRLPWEGTIRVQSPSQGGTVGASPLPALIPPNTNSRILISHQMVSFATDIGGHCSLPIELSATNSPVRHISARISLLDAMHASTPPRIDADLVDWPVGTTNVAGDFALIPGIRRDSVESGRLRPSNETLVFGMADADYLYLAVNCKLAGRAASIPLGSTRKFAVEYEDLIPVSDELIEVLFDPLNAGTRSPGDLYHVVIKRAGPAFTEKGLRVDPPVAPWAPWPIEWDYSVAEAGDRWFAEMRIPLAAFGTEGATNAIWGFNVSRFDAANQEFSTWSGAIGNAYDPLSLGNLMRSGQPKR